MFLVPVDDWMVTFCIQGNVLNSCSLVHYPGPQVVYCCDCPTWVSSEITLYSTWLLSFIVLSLLKFVLGHLSRSHSCFFCHIPQLVWPQSQTPTWPGQRSSGTCTEGGRSGCAKGTFARLVPDTWMPYSGHIQETLLAIPAMTISIPSLKAFMLGVHWNTEILLVVAKSKWNVVEEDEFVHIFHREVFSLWCHH